MDKQGAIWGPAPTIWDAWEEDGGSLRADKCRISWLTEKVWRIQSSRCMRSLTYLRYQNCQHPSKAGQNTESVLPNTLTLFCKLEKILLRNLHFPSAYFWWMFSLTCLPLNLQEISNFSLYHSLRRDFDPFHYLQFILFCYSLLELKTFYSHVPSPLFLLLCWNERLYNTCRINYPVLLDWRPDGVSCGPDSLVWAVRCVLFRAVQNGEIADWNGTLTPCTAGMYRVWYWKDR